MCDPFFLGRAPGPAGPADPVEAWAEEQLAPYDREAEAPLDLGLLIAQVCAVYPGSYRGADTEAPFFWLLCRRMRPVLALERVQLTRAVSLGAGLVMNGSEVRPLAERDIREAHAATG